MYTLSEAYQIIGPAHANELWCGKMACAKSDARRTLLTNELGDTVSVFSFTLVECGRLVLATGGEPFEIAANDVYVYFPGQPVRILEVSDDYQGICLMVDEQTTYGTTGFRNLLRASVLPLSQFGKSRIALTAGDASRIGMLLSLIGQYIARSFPNKDQTLEMLYSVLLADLIHVQDFASAGLPFTRRTEELFISFYALVRQHFAEQHGIGFYADRLSVSTTYLSRVVKQVLGATVVECINQMLVVESRWLLSTTSLTVSQIADRLHFSSAAAFDKFFKRATGCTPLSMRTRC